MVIRDTRPHTIQKPWCFTVSRQTVSALWWTAVVLIIGANLACEIVLDTGTELGVSGGLLWGCIIWFGLIVFNKVWFWVIAAVKARRQRLRQNHSKLVAMLRGGSMGSNQDVEEPFSSESEVSCVTTE